MYFATVFLVLPICLALAALTDFLEMTIPNRIPVILVTAFLVAAPFSGLSLGDLAWHFAAAGSVFVVVFALFALNVMGGGDAKLLSAAALWFGFNASLAEFLILTAYIGGALTILVILARAHWLKLEFVGIRLPQTLMVANKIPYAIAIGAAGLIAYPSSPLVMAAIRNLG